MELKMLRVDQIKPNPFELRASLDKEKLRELTDSIKEVEMLEPIHVRKRGEKYEIIAGGRRWLAAKALGLREIPAIVKDADDRTLLVEALITNVQHEDLAEVAKALGVLQIFRLYGFEEDPRNLSKKIRVIRDKVRLGKPVAELREKELLKVAKKTSFGLHYLADLLNVASLPKDLLEREIKKKPENRIDYASLARLAIIGDKELQKKIYKYLERERPTQAKAKKIITEIRYSSELVRKYILSTKVEDLDLEKIGEIRATFRSEEDQTKVINLIMQGEAEISDAIKAVEVEKGMRDDFDEYLVRYRWYNDWKQLGWKHPVMVEGFSDDRICDRFHTRPKLWFPVTSDGVVCPSFMELKWARGCPFNCAWCYLQGTLRHMKEGKGPVIYDYEKTRKRVITQLYAYREPQIWVTGEIADSLMGEHLNPPFSRFIIDLYKEYGNGHKVLFLSKSPNVENLLKANGQDVVIVSFSLNAYLVSERWEKAPHPRERIKAAKRVHDAGYETRIRIDPMVPIEGWEEAYHKLVDDMFVALEPERITFGSLRGLQSTINEAKDKSWVKYLSEKTEWGKKIAFDTRLQMYRTLVDYIRGEHHYKGHLAMCKETLGMWTKMGWDYRKCRCNCVW